jgi:uncharacterized protein (DUF302 family)
MGENMYRYSKLTNLDFEKSIEKTKSELQTEGFGVLTEIDVQATLKEKIAIDVDKYIILGACNPPNAYRALEVEKEIGLMLPCNVIVYVTDGKTSVSAILPKTAMAMIDNAELTIIAEEIENKLKKVIDRV